MTDAQGLTWGYTYDASGRLVSETDYDGGTTAYSYDAAGMLTGRTNALGQTTTYRYDTVGNLVEKDIAGHRVRYAHDPKGACCGPNHPTPSSSTRTTWSAGSSPRPSTAGPWPPPATPQADGSPAPPRPGP